MLLASFLALIEFNCILPFALWKPHEQRQVRAIPVADALHLYRAARAVGTRHWGTASSSATSATSLSQRANRLLVKFFLHDSRELLLHVVLQKFDQRVKADFLVHDCHASLWFVAGHDKSREQDLLQFLVTEVRKWQIAQFLHDCVLATLQKLLRLLVEEAEVSDEHESLMKQLPGVFILVIVLMGVHQQVVHQMEHMIKQNFVLDEELLHKFDVHADDVVQHLDGYYWQAQECLRHYFRGILVLFEAVAWRLELLGVRQEEGGDHVDDPKRFCIFHHEQVVLAQFVVSLVGGSVACVARNDGCERLEESDALEQEQGHLSHHLAHVHGHRIINDLELAFDFVHQLGANQHFDQVFFALDALVGSSVLNVESDNLEQLGKESDAEEYLRRPVHAPVEQIHQRHYPIRLQHVVTVFTQWAENRNYPDAQLNRLPQMSELLSRANQNSLADVYQRRNEFQFPKQHQVTLVLALEQFHDLLEILLERFVVTNDRVDLLFQVEASDLERLLVEWGAVLPRLLAPRALMRHCHLLQLHFKSLDLSLQGLFLFAY